ncbi:DsbA family protein [Patescibacteria group bacterium]|nr:DsbA family protein [Patescibacteria group bacterium]
MKKNSKLVLSIVGIIIIGIIVVVWIMPNDTTTYTNVDSPRPFKGNPDARVVVQEFSDFQCPACRAGAKSINLVLEKFGDQIKLEFKHFPLTTIHENAFNAALASECANDQGKFWELHDKMFDNQDSLKKDDLKLYAGQIDGLDNESFSACLDTHAEKDIVNSDVKDAENLGLRGTPTFFVNGREIENYNSLEEEIQKGLL